MIQPWMLRFMGSLFESERRGDKLHITVEPPRKRHLTWPLGLTFFGEHLEFSGPMAGGGLMEVFRHGSGRTRIVVFLAETAGGFDGPTA